MLFLYSRDFVCLICPWSIGASFVWSCRTASASQDSRRAAHLKNGNVGQPQRLPLLLSSVETRGRLSLGISTLIAIMQELTEYTEFQWLVLRHVKGRAPLQLDTSGLSRTKFPTLTSDRLLE